MSRLPGFLSFFILSVLAGAPLSGRSLGEALRMELDAIVRQAETQGAVRVTARRLGPQGAMISDPALAAQIARLLKTNGGRIRPGVEADRELRVTVSRNASGPVLVSEWVGPEAHKAWVIPFEAGPERSNPVGLRLLPVYESAGQVLDASPAGAEGLWLILEPGRLVAGTRQQNHWTEKEAIAFDPGSRLPRDLRGRIWTESPKPRAFLPGVTCRLTAEPLAAVCEQEEDAPWPLDARTSALFVEGRNHFAGRIERTGRPSLSEEPFFTLADVGDSLFLLGIDGQISVWKPDRKQPLDTAADEIATIADPCEPGRNLLLTAKENLSAFRWDGGALRPAGEPAVLPGEVAALWTHSGGTVTAIVRRESRRYAVFEAIADCLN